MLALDATMAWALEADLSEAVKAVEAAANLPIVAIGSGGSLTAAHFLAGAQRHLAGQLAAVSTPYEVAAEPLDRRMSAWLLSAGGGNSDIRTAFQAIVDREPVHLAVVCGRRGSPLAKLAGDRRHVSLVDFDLPAGKDGFLATNSLLAFCLVIARTYAAVYKRGNQAGDIPWDGPERLRGMATDLAAWEEAARDLWARSTTIVLHGNATRAAAIDLESKFTEAAIGHLQVADFRNFGHGRHVWVAKHGLTSGILAFTTPDDRDLAAKTLALLPADVPVVRIDLEGDYLATAVQAIVAALHLAGWAGAARGLDPGRPGVPEFGRQLYHLRVPAGRRASRGPQADALVAVERKSGSTWAKLQSSGAAPHWLSALQAFEASLSEAPFHGVVFDYDGTLVETRDRFAPPCDDIAAELRCLLDAGTVLGIATGRGDSVRADLRSVIPKSHWERVLVGYYNCAEVGTLVDDLTPAATEVPVAALQPFADALRSHPELTSIARTTVRARQITLRPCGLVPESRLWELAMQVANDLGAPDVVVVRSSHSVDILAPGVAKPRILGSMAELCEVDEARILKIGDRGRWPGNDFALLREPHSLSVDEVSTDPHTCWNLAPRGYRGVDATVGYLRRLRPSKSGLSWVPSGPAR